MAKKSAGILVYKFINGIIQFLLVHPGGPFYQKKDEGVWSIPKGEFTEDEDAMEAAKREFLEELGSSIDGRFIELTPVKLKSGKTVYTWAIESDFDITQLNSNSFSLEWPPKSGKFQQFPEVDKAEWFSYGQAKIKINQSQFVIVEELLSKLNLNSENRIDDVPKKSGQLDLF